MTELARGLVALRSEWDELGVIFLERVGVTGDRSLELVWAGTMSPAAYEHERRVHAKAAGGERAMAAGCAVIASNTSSLPEVAGDAALLVDPEDPAPIAQAILLLTRDPEQRRELVRRGARQVQTFSLQAQARGALAGYRRAGFC